MISQYGNVPRIQYGIGLDVTYKSFDFGMFFNGSANGQSWYQALCISR